MDFIEQHQAEDWANARHRPQAFERLWVMLPRSTHDMVLEVPDEPIIILDQGQLDFDVFLLCWIGKALGAPLTRRFGLERLTSRGQIVLAVRLANMSPPLRPLASQMQTAPQQVTGGTHGGRIRIGLRQHAAPS